MNVDKIVQKYFVGGNILPTIEVFDNSNIYQVYQDVVNLLKDNPDIELSVLQIFSYCFYEILDNALIHSGKNCGTIVMRYLPNKHRIQFLVGDDGIGVRNSLSQNPIYADIDEADALVRCVEDQVTDGQGMGFGLFSTMKMVQNTKAQMIIHSGTHILLTDGSVLNIQEAEHWQGTIVFVDIQSNVEVEPNKILDYRADCEDEYNSEFENNDELKELW